ncbi:S phase cyclin A-associated protein in the endoplasmic reticulum-like [Myotis lucifugus]|uniref:S phase cyclin A-associated protein in the endoplasmic reticulum-like n=1 Tax=Myotis lucifugus TaxID=59463 RepID=UPI000CCC2598|nr:S phase cyclin A-associated protein in the endoplasmic reticulum-like [Myotis lucifugus]
MLYGVLFHGAVADPGTASPKESYSQSTVQVAIQSLRFFNSFAALDLPAFQSIVGAEGLSLAFRHIASSLLGHCSHVSCESLLHEVIVCVGYFTVNHPDNQVKHLLRVSGLTRQDGKWDRGAGVCRWPVTADLGLQPSNE